MLLKIRWRGLRTRIIAWSFVPTAIILAAVAWVTFYAYQRVTQDLVIERNQEVARLSAGQLASGMDEYTSLLDGVTRQYGVSLPAPTIQTTALKNAADSLSVFDGGTVILDHLGTVVATWPERPDLLHQDWSNRDIFRKMLHSPGPVFSNISPDGPEGTPVVMAAVPILSQKREVLGTLVGMFRLDATAVSAFYGGIVKLRIGGGTTYLVDTTGRVIYHTDAAHIGEDFSHEEAVQRVMAGQSGSMRTVDLANRTILKAYAPVVGTPWGLVIEEDWSSLMRAGRGYQQFLLLLLALGILVPVIVVAVGIRRITRPIEDLTAAAQEVAGGKFGQEIKFDTGDELSELAGQFNLMSAELRASYANLEQRVADRTKELAALNAIAAVVSQSLDLDEILQDALDKVLEVTRQESGVAFSLEEGRPGDEAERYLVLRGRSGVPDDIANLLLRRPVGYASLRAEAEGRPSPWRVEDYPESELKEALLRNGFHQVITVPLTSKGRLLGAINLATPGEREFSDEEISLLIGIGQQVGVAVENARLYEKAEEVAAAAERSRLARDLHDAVTQTLFSASLIAEVLPKIWDRNPAEGRRRLDELRQLTRGALAEMRTLLLELRPAALIEIPLADLLRQLSESTTGRARLPVTLSVEGQRALQPDVKLVLYRIAQEALNNVAKHSGASAATVSLRYLSAGPAVPEIPGDEVPRSGSKEDGLPPLGKGEGVELCIGDNGRGFDPAKVPPNHLGVGIMRERAESIRATLSIDSEPGQGTEVWVVWRNC